MERSLTDCPLRVLLAEDEISLRGPLAKRLRYEYGYEVDTAGDLLEARSLFLQTERLYDVALIDDLLAPAPGEEPEYVGIALLREIKERWSETEVIIFTGWGMDRALEALQAGAYRYMAKPLNLDELGMTIRMAAERRRLRRQLETTRQEKEWLQTFLEIGRATASVLELDEVLESVYEQVGRLMDVSCLDVVLYDESAQTLRFELGYDRGVRDGKWERSFTPGHGLTDWVIEHRKPLLIGDYLNEPTPVSAYHRGEASRSWLGVPLVSRDRVIGAITVQSYEPDQFHETHQQLLITVASQVANAVENARLFSEAAETRERLDALVASSFDAMIYIDRDRKIRVFNRAAEEMVGWTAQEMIGRTVARLHTDFEGAREILDAVNRDGAISGWSVELKHRDGSTIPALLSAVLIRNSQGDPIGQAGFLRDLRGVRLLEDQLRALIQVGQSIAGARESGEVLDLIVESAVEVFPTAQKGSIHLYDEKTGLLHIRASRGYSPEVVQALTLAVGEGRAGWVYEHAAPLLVPNCQEDERSRKVDGKIRHAEVQDQKSAICVPLVVGDRVIGTLSLDNVTIFEAFEPEDVGLLSLFASQAAVAIVNAELAAKDRERLARLEMISRASNEMMSNLHSLNIDDRLKLIVERAARVLDAEASSILLVRRPGFLRKEASYGHVGRSFRKGREFPIKSGKGTGLTGHIAYTGELFNAHGDDLLGHWAVAGEPIVHLPTGKCCSLLAIPLERMVGGSEELIGLLEVENKKDADGQPKCHIGFTKEDEWILSVFADTVVICLENAELYERTSDRLEEKVASLKAIQETGAAINAHLELDELLGLVAEKAAGVFAAPAASLMLWDAAKENLLVRARYGLADAYTGQCIPREKVEAVVSPTSEPSPLVTADLRRTPFGQLDLIEAEDLCSVLSAPLVVSGRLIGILNIYSKGAPREFTSDEIEVAEVLATQAAVAIRNAQLYEQIQQRASVLQTLYDAGQTITASLDIDTILDRLVRQAQQLTRKRGEEAYFGDILLVDGRQLRFASAFPAGLLDDLKRRLGSYVDLDAGVNGRIGITGRVVKTGESQLVGDVTKDPDFYQACVGQTLSELVVPIKIGSKVIGVINVEHPSYNAFDEGDQRALESLAAQAAIAIQNARLYEQATERLSESQALRQVATSLAGTLGLEEVLHVVMMAATKLTDTDSGSILFWDSQAKTFTHVLTTAGPDRELRPYRSRVRREGGIARGIIDDRMPAVIPDTLKDPRVSPVAIRKGRRALIGVPLVSREEPIGVLYVSSSEPHVFSGRQVTLLETLASQAAVAIERARQYEELRQTKGLVGARTALAWMGMASSAWRHGIVKHALTIQEQSQLLREDIVQVPSQDRHLQAEERLHMIEQLTRQILEKPITPPLSAEEGASSVSINGLIRERTKQLWQSEPYRSVELDLDLHLDDQATVRASSEWLRRALDVLVDNAVEAVADCAPKRITVVTQQKDKQAEILVSDTGTGIPEEDLAVLLWEPIRKLKGAQGLGMGLLMAQAIVQTYGGDIEVGATGPTGTTMCIMLPLETSTA